MSGEQVAGCIGIVDRVVAAVQTERVERLVDRMFRLADNSAWLAHLNTDSAVDALADKEPCSRCEGITYDGLLDEWGRCDSCVDAARQDAADGYDEAED